MDTTSQDTPAVPDEVEQRRARQAALKDRHARSVAALMSARDDLRGVHALADLVDDAVRWTA